MFSLFLSRNLSFQARARISRGSQKIRYSICLGISCSCEERQATFATGRGRSGRKGRKGSDATASSFFSLLDTRSASNIAVSPQLRTATWKLASSWNRCFLAARPITRLPRFARRVALGTPRKCRDTRSEEVLAPTGKARRVDHAFHSAAQRKASTIAANLQRTVRRDRSPHGLGDFSPAKSTVCNCLRTEAGRQR